MSRGAGVLAPQCEPQGTRLPHPEGIGPANATRFVLMASYPEENVSLGRYPGILPETEGMRVALRDEVMRRIIDSGFDGATIVHTDGMYRHIQEPGLRAEVIVSLLNDPDAANRLMELATELAIDWEQEEVWLTSEPVSLMRLKGK